MPVQANLFTSWKRFIISVVNQHLIPYRSITWIWIQARKIKHHENSKKELQQNKSSVYDSDNSKYGSGKL
jgi:hypothetical protein